MVSVAESLATPRTRLPMTWEDYNDLGDNVRGEYIDGELVMAPSPDFYHQDSVFHLTYALRQVLAGEERAVGGWGWTPAGVTEEYVPDVMVVPRLTDATRFTGVPLLCVEVTSSNRSNDLILKRAKYAAAGLKDYWVVDRKEQAIIRYELQDSLLVQVDRQGSAGQLELSFDGRSVLVDSDLLLAHT